MSETFPGDRLELLQTFVRIVEAGSLSAAAAQLGTSQPTVSRRLQSLERFFGVRLLQRSTHGMKLTADGERCFAQSRTLIEGWQALAEGLRGDEEEPAGTLRVVAPHAFGQSRLVEPLLRYLRRYPHMSVEWLLHDRRPDFIAEGIDCAIQVGEVNDPSVVAIRLFDVPRIVVGAPSLLPRRAIPTQASELHALPWLALQTFYRDKVTLTHTHSGERHTFPIRPRMSTDSLYALRTALLGGLGVGIASAWVVADDLRNGDLRHLAPAWSAPSLPAYLVYPHAPFYPARLRRFLEAMRKSPAP